MRLQVQKSKKGLLLSGKQPFFVRANFSFGQKAYFREKYLVHPTLNFTDMHKLLTPLPLLAAFLLGALTFSITEKLSREDVEHAARIMGLTFTQAEIDSLLPDLEEKRNEYNANRKSDLPNSLSPALVFNPLPPGFQIDRNQKPPRFEETGGVMLPKDREALAWLSVKELAELLRTRQITSVELSRFFLERLKKHDPQLHFVISYTEELAMEQARRADVEIAAGKYKGYLHGIPYGAKDLLSVKGYKTTWGAMPYKNQVIDEDATVIKKLEDAGAVLLAKMTLGALAWGDVWYGEKTRNPWNPEQGSSGSSAGSASAVAAGCLPFAIGTETLGSIVSPSTVCGTTGLRPTFGRVSRTGAMALSWSMDKIGPICRTVEDCAVVFDAIRGADGKDRSVVEAAFNYDAGLPVKSLKIGYVKSHFENDYNFKQQDSLTLATLRFMGFELLPIELPPLPDIRFILSAEAAAAFDELTRSGKDDLLVRQIRRAWPNVFRASRFIPAVEYIQANRLRSQLIAQMDDVFRQVDVYLAPSWGSSSLTITNLTGHPAVVLPNGFRFGTPTSITFTGKLFGEAELLSVAKAYQEGTKWHKRHPGK
jgi:Asp-tRNA(Asn)/Glu-tRNA(Gln) amidotransferase A subunit family amidase